MFAYVRFTPGGNQESGNCKPASSGWSKAILTRFSALRRVSSPDNTFFRPHLTRRCQHTVLGSMGFRRRDTVSAALTLADVPLAARMASARAWRSSAEGGRTLYSLERS